MAKTESQGLQIAVIIFAILVILLSVSTYYFFNEWSEAEKRETDANSKAAQADVAARKADQDLAQLAGLIGVSTDGTAQEMFKRAVEAWEADKTAFAGTLPEQKQNYREALATFHGELIKTNAEINDERDKLVAMEAAIQALEGKWTERLNAVKTAFEADSQNFLRELADRKNERAGDLQQVAALDAKISDGQSKYSDMEGKLQANVTAVKKELVSAEAEAFKSREKINELTNQTFEVADGEIRFVSPTSRTVYINLGEGDKLRPQITFSVYSEDANEVARTGRKGAIEVTRILGETMAECRILEDQVANPMLPGDKIYTPLWHPGRQEHFALSGTMDIDGNGSSDWQLVHDLVRLGGGVIDAELTPAGKIQGEMGASTRYLVTGASPKEHGKEHAEMVSMATRKGIQIMPLDKFLDYIGFAGVSKVVELGPYSDPKDFNTPRKEMPPLRKPKFRSRRPLSGANGAYGDKKKETDPSKPEEAPPK